MQSDYWQSGVWGNFSDRQHEAQPFIRSKIYCCNETHLAIARPMVEGESSMSEGLPWSELPPPQRTTTDGVWWEFWGESRCDPPTNWSSIWKERGDKGLKAVSEHKLRYERTRGRRKGVLMSSKSGQSGNEQDDSQATRIDGWTPKLPRTPANFSTRIKEITSQGGNKRPLSST